MTDTISRILDNFKTIAVVGLSPKPHRDSHEVSEYMQAHGYRIVPVNPAAMTSEILGEKVYPSLLEAARHEHRCAAGRGRCHCHRRQSRLAATWN